MCLLLLQTMTPLASRISPFCPQQFDPQKYPLCGPLSVYYKEDNRICNCLLNGLLNSVIARGNVAKIIRLFNASQAPSSHTVCSTFGEDSLKRSLFYFKSHDLKLFWCCFSFPEIQISVSSGWSPGFSTWWPSVCPLCGCDGFSRLITLAFVLVFCTGSLASPGLPVGSLPGHVQPVLLLLSACHLPPLPPSTVFRRAACFTVYCMGSVSALPGSHCPHSQLQTERLPRGSFYTFGVPTYSC